MESFRKYLLASLLLQISTRHFSLFYTNYWVEKAGNFVRDVYFWSEMKRVETERDRNILRTISYNVVYIFDKQETEGLFREIRIMA